jgi:CheY-like chemotaxis protein
MSKDGIRRRILVIEDEALIAMLLEDILLEIDDYDVDIVAQFSAGLEAARSGDYAFAVLDVNLNGVRSYPIADVLSERGIPYVFSTGYGAEGLEPAYAGQLVLQKPFQADQLRSTVAQLLGGR